LDRPLLEQFHQQHYNNIRFYLVIHFIKTNVEDENEGARLLKIFAKLRKKAQIIA
jgi:hypothetical protein